MLSHTVDHPHLLALPRSFPVLKYIHLTIAIVTIILSSYCFSILHFPTHIYTIASSLYTLIITAYYLITSHKAPKAYNWIALLVLEIFGILIWLACAAVLAVLVGITDDSHAQYGAQYTDSTYGQYMWGNDPVLFSESVGYGACQASSLGLAIIQLYVYHALSATHLSLSMR